MQCVADPSLPITVASDTQTYWLAYRGLCPVLYLACAAYRIMITVSKTVGMIVGVAVGMTVQLVFDAMHRALDRTLDLGGEV